MPKLLLIIDEYHEMFRDRDSQVCRESAKLLETLLEQGHSFGIYVILASQDPGQAKTLDPIVYNQMAYRIAMSCGTGTGRVILSDDNPAVDSLMQLAPGQAIFNSSLGNRDYNIRCRIALLCRIEDLDNVNQENLNRRILETQKELLRKIGERQAKLYPDFEYKTRILILQCGR